MRSRIDPASTASMSQTAPVATSAATGGSPRLEEESHMSSSKTHEAFLHSRRFESDTFQSTHQLPPSLLQEVEELLEKERTLMELKLLEQTVESQHWRQKYDEMREHALDEVLEEKVEEIALDKLEEMAELAIKDPPPATVKDANAILNSRVVGTLVDLSHIELNKTVFIYLSRILFGTRSMYNHVRILHVSDCELQVDHLEPLLHVLRNPKCEAIDMSRNHLTEDMLAKILEILRSRKMTPQYVLLDGNSKIATTSKVFKDIVDILSYDTWGLTLSLQDILNNPRETYDEFLRAHRKKFKKDPSLGFRQIVKNPMRILHFLGTLIDKVEQAKKKEDILLGVYQGDKSKTKRPSTANKGKHGKMDPRQVDVFQGLSVLGLMENHLSRQSIDALEKCISIMHTLTDLDLSFAYMGYYGAVVFERVLADPNCSLIRLDLRGNVLTDQGLSKIQQGLQKNRSLIYLGLASNAITASAQLALASSLLNNRILHTVDLRNNEEVSFEDMDAVQNRFDAIGSTLLIKWDTHSKLLPSQQAMLTAGKDLWFFQPFTTTKYCHLDSSCRLLEMDIATMFNRQEHLSSEVLVLRWLMRPVTVGRDLAALKQQFLEQTMKNKKSSKIPHEPYFYLNSLVFLYWEIRVVHQKTVVYRHEEQLDQDFPVRDFYTPDLIMPWVSCSALLKDLPKKGQIEVRLMARSRGVGELSFEVDAMVAVELQQCWGGVQHNTEAVYAGGDGPSAEVDSDQLQYSLQRSYQLELRHPELKYHNVLRGLLWNNPHCKQVKLKWRMKLYVVHDVQIGDEDDLHLYDDVQSPIHRDDDRPEQFNLIQYEWAVSVHPWFGSRRVVDSQRCDGKAGSTKTACDPFQLIEYYESKTEEEREMDTKEARAHDRKGSVSAVGEVDRTELDDVDPLLAWTWRTFETTFDNVLAGDRIVLTAKLVSPNPRAAAKLASNCRIKAEDFEVYHVVGDLHHHTNEELQKMLPLCSDPQAIFDSPVRTFNQDEELFPGEYSANHIFNLRPIDYDYQDKPHF